MSIQIKQGSRFEATKFYEPSRPCSRCGTRLRYQSTRHCVSCKREYDRQREGDRRGKRRRAIDRLEREGVAVRELPIVMQEAFLRMYYPNWESEVNER